MNAQRAMRVGLGLAIALAGLISSRAGEARGADLPRYISPDFCAAIVIHPARIGKTELWQAIRSSLPKEVASADPVKAAIEAMAHSKTPPPGMDAAKLTSLLAGKTLVRIVILIDPLPAPNVPVSPAFIVQFGEDLDSEAVFAAFSNAWETGEANGVKYKKLKTEPGKPDGGAVMPDARTLIVADEATLVKMLAKEQGKSPLFAQLQHSRFDNDVLVEFVASPLLAPKAGGMTLEKAAGPAGAAVAQHKDKVKAVTVKFNFSGKTLLHVEVVTDKPESAAMYVGLAQFGLAGAKPQLEELKKKPLPFVPEAAAPVIYKLADEILAGLSVTSESDRVVAELAMPASLPEAVKVLVPLAAQGFTLTPKPSGSK